MKKIGILFATVIMIILFAMSASANDNTYEVGDIIQFGSYPQTEVKDETLISELNALAPEWNNWISYEYYSGNRMQGTMKQGDWMRYIDILHKGNKYRGVKFTTYRPSFTFDPSFNLFNTYSSQDNNLYYFDNIYWFKFEPINWVLLDKDDLLIMSLMCIDSQPYTNTIYKIDGTNLWSNDRDNKHLASDYETSSIRNWLNGDFYNLAFSSVEKDNIKLTKINNYSYNTLIGNSGYENLDSNSTTDNVFLLSYDELISVDTKFHIANGTDYAKCQGLFVYDGYEEKYKGNTIWNLRSPDGDSYSCCSFYYDCCVYNLSVLYDSSYGVRPVLRINKIPNVVQPEHKHDYNLNLAPPTCTVTGTITYICSCGDIYTESIPATNHINATTDLGKEPTETEVGYTAGKYCPDCKIWIEGHTEIPKLHTHSYASSITKTPTCTLTGTKIYTCTCGDTYTETIPATNHPNATTDPGKAPTTTEVGYTAGKYCPDCKIWIEGHTEIPKLHTHSYASSITKTPTCTLTGTKIYTCTCGDTYTETIPATNHANATTDAGKAPTTTEVGYTAGKYCPDCKTWLEGHAEIPMLEAHVHSYTSTITTEPTCTTAGTTTYTCTCGDTYTETIPATNHANATTDAGKAPTTTEVGYTAGKYCPDCKVWIEGHEEIPKLEEHEHQFAQVDKKHSTCTETGIRYYECYCGAKREEEIPMMPHVFIYDSYEKWPTCTEEGIMKTECSCGEKSQETIPANGHSLAYNIEVEATCTKDGLTRGSYCPNCDLVYEPQKVIPAFGHNFKIELIKGTLTMGGMANRVCQNCRATKTIAYYPVVNSFKIYDAEYIYDGKVKKPVVVVNDETGESLVEGRDYTLSYEDGRKLPGKYAIKITLMGNYEGEKTIYFSILPGKTSKLVASQTNDTITLKWRKVEGATGYRVYQYNSKTKKYVKLKNTTGTSYTVKKLKAGTTYKFAVKAYTRVDGEVIWADSYKTLKTATKPATPTVKVTAGTKKATLSWNKVTGATGYVIFMRNSDGSYEKVGTTKKTSYTVSNLSYGEKCYFRVRAYKTVDGKNIYGGFKTYSATVPYPAVYVTPSGKRYHYDKECAGKNATKTTFANAQKTKTPCKTCVI